VKACEGITHPVKKSEPMNIKLNMRNNLDDINYYFVLYARANQKIIKNPANQRATGQQPGKSSYE